MSKGVEETIAEQQEADDNAFDEAFDEATGTSSTEPKKEAELEEEVSEEEGKPDAEELPDKESKDEDIPKEESELSVEEQLAQITKERDEYRQKFNSNNGRISAYQRQINDLTQKIQNPASSNAERKQAKEDLAQQNNNSNWNEFKEEFPEFAAALDERLSEIDVREKRFEERFGNLENQVQPLQEQAYQSAIKLEYSALAAEHPDYETVAVSPAFNEWLGLQPLPVQQLIDSNSAADAAYLLSSFKRDTGTNSGSSEPQINQQNRSRLQSNVAVQSKRTARRPVADDDFDSAFDAAVADGNRNR